MAESLSHWLALREPVDHASRSIALTRAIASALPVDRPLRIVDLGSGTGSNVRYLSPLLPSPQRWLVVDREPALMAQATASAASIESRTMNLGEFDAGVIAGAHLVTGSALLDLVSDSWLRRLAQACRAHRAAALFALTYNGQSRCSPAEPEDDAVRELFNTHQRRNDKGFGAAAGPDAVESAAAAFADAGYRVRREPSDWILTPNLPDLQAQLIDGWAEAATEIAPGKSPFISNWRARRQMHVSAGRSTIVVSHEDLGAILDE
jgi:SAM-dependent methyltransferase